MTKVFIGSTGLDLKEYREAARDMCLAMGFEPVMMEYWEAMGVGATEGSLKKLSECHLYVGIFAHRYGYCEDGYGNKSVTEIEFDTAASEHQLTRLCFVIEDDYSWPPNFIEFGKAKKKMDAFKAKIKKLICNFFTSVDDFKAKLTISLHN